MKKFISVLLLSIMAVMLIACSNSNQQSLDGEYYWVSSERNELAFTIKVIKVPLNMEKPITLRLINKRKPSS